MGLRRKELVEAKFSVFRNILHDEDPSYTALTSLRSFFRKQEETELNKKKIRHIQNRMKAKIDNNEITGKKRVPGTGRRVVTQFKYKDTADNRKAGRVGQTYERVTYEDAEYTDYTQKKMRRLKLKRKREVDEDGNPIEPKKKRNNFWIDAMKEAKEQLDAPKMLLPRKTVSDPDDADQVLGNKVYLLAVELNKKKKEEAAAEAAKQAAMEGANPAAMEVEEAH